jgi:uncharacterized cupredoxin-like copper-binding protein
VVLRLAAGYGDQEPSTAGEDAAELLERRERGAGIGLGRGSVDAVVAPHVLERRDAEREIEGAVLEREAAHVGNDRPHPRHARLDEVDADELRRAACEQRREVGGLRVRGADVEDALARPHPRERPRDLDRPLVRPRRRLEEPIPACRERLVERRELLELRAGDELAKERGARNPALERGRLGIAPQDEPIGAPDELLVREVRELEMRLQPVVHRGRDGSFRAVLLALSTWHKIGLAGVAVVFILFALASSFLLPRYRPQYPGRRLGTFILATLALFVAMLVAVEIFGRESAEKAAGEAEPAAATSNAQKVPVKEMEFKIELPSTKLKAGDYEFELANDGNVPHDLTIEGPQVDKAKTPEIQGGQDATLKVKLVPGTYDFYCSVPGHKQAGMDVKVTVS